MKAYNIFLFIGSCFMMMFIFKGCACKEPEPVIMYKTIIETKDVYIEVPCKVPVVKCDFKGDGYTPTVKLLECISEQKKAIESCNKK